VDIKFTKLFDVDEAFYPKPASSFIPDWYKDLESYLGGEKKPLGDGQTTATIKKCMPVFDSMASGYILSTHTDLYISQKPEIDEKGGPTGETVPWYEWPAYDFISWHPIHQAPTHPLRNKHKSVYPKFMNPWAIKTQPGYSCLFLQPMHRESKFTILPGVVDTDRYTAPVNFPFVLNDLKIDELIPAGTPFAQVIPFKRDAWKMSFGSQEDYLEQLKVMERVRIFFFDSYKRTYRQLKEYK
jgi:hypothetical protein